MKYSYSLLLIVTDLGPRSCCVFPTNNPWISSSAGYYLKLFMLQYKQAPPVYSNICYSVNIVKIWHVLPGQHSVYFGHAIDRIINSERELLMKMNVWRDPTRAHNILPKLEQFLCFHMRDFCVSCSSVLFSQLWSWRDKKKGRKERCHLLTMHLSGFRFIQPNENQMTVGGLFGRCQSNVIKSHPHSPDEAN